MIMGINQIQEKQEHRKRLEDFEIENKNVLVDIKPILTGIRNVLGITTLLLVLACVILLAGCSKLVLTVVKPAIDTSVVAQSEQPKFVLGMPFGDVPYVEPVRAMPVWVPSVVEAPAKCVLNSDRVVVLHDTTIVPTYIKSVHYDTVTIHKPDTKTMLNIFVFGYCAGCIVMAAVFVIAFGNLLFPK